jgi:hypothetical protein
MDSPEDDSPEAVQRAKDAYLSHPDFLNQSNGGSVEMYLLSHAMDGCLSFLVVDVETQRCREPLRRYCAVNLEEDERRPEILRYRKEIALHYCVYSGKQGDAPNHYDCIDYKFSDDRMETQWEIASETTRQRRAREELLLRVAKAAVNNNRTDAAGKELMDYLAAEELAAEQSRTPHNSPPRTGRAKTNRRTPQQPEHNVLSPRAHLSRTRATPNQQQGPASPTRGKCGKTETETTANHSLATDNRSTAHSGTRRPRNNNTVDPVLEGRVCRSGARYSP